MRQIHASLLALILLFGTALIVSPANGQERRSNTEGFTIGASLLGSSVSTNIDNVTVTESGSGFHFEVGWGFTPRFMVFLGGYGSAIESDADYTIGQGDLGLRYLFRGGDKRARPYVEGAIAARQFRLDYGAGLDAVTIKASSAGFALGGGVQVFFNPKFALDIGATYTPGSFSDWTANGVTYPFQDLDAPSTQVRLGLRFWPMQK